MKMPHQLNALFTETLQLLLRSLSFRGFHLQTCRDDVSEEFFAPLICDGVRRKIPFYFSVGWHHFEIGENMGKRTSGYGVAGNPVSVIVFQLVKYESYSNCT